MARDLKTDMETLRQVLNLAQNRDFQGAGDLAARTLASGFEHPMLLNVVATRLEQQGRFDDALALLQRAVTLSPKDVGARNALSLCLQRLDRPAEALVHVDELLKQHPELGFVHANKGNALIALGALGHARQCHQRALELDPANLAAMAALGSIATHLGDHADARRWAERTLAVAPGYPDAVMSLAAADLAEGSVAQAEKLLHQLIVDHRAGGADKARASGLLGDVLDSAGRYDEAFDAYMACNDALRQIHARIAQDTSILAYTRSILAALDTVGASVRSAAESQPGGPVEHVFLLGFPRSGTTLLEVVLDGHTGVSSVEEHELLTEAVLEYMREPVDLEPLMNADETRLSMLRAAYWQRVQATGAQVAGKVFVDKHPLNTLKLPLIARLFPSAKILLASRDPRDVVLSCFRRRFRMNQAMYQLLTLPGAAAFYDAVMELAHRVLPSSGLDWRVVRYESLVADISTETRGICEFLGLEWTAGMNDFAGRVSLREHATPSTAQLARGLDASSVDQWQRYAARLAPILPVLNPWAQRLGYAIGPDARGTDDSMA